MIDFSGCNFQDRNQAAIKRVLLANPSLGDLVFYKGRNKVVFSSSLDNHTIIYKVSMWDRLYQKINALYNFALEEGVSCFFLKNMLLYECNGIQVFYQEKAFPVGYFDIHYELTKDIVKIAYPYVQFVINRGIVNPNKKDLQDSFYLFLHCVEQYSSLEEAKKLVQFLVKYGVQDIIPLDNVGITVDGRPVIIDYDICFDF